MDNHENGFYKSVGGHSSGSKNLVKYNVHYKKTYIKFCLFSIPEGQAGFEELSGGHQVAAPFQGLFQHHRVQSKKQNWLLNVYICQGGVIIKNKLNREAKCWFSLRATGALTSYTVNLNLINNSFLIKGYQTWFANLATCNEKSPSLMDHFS